MVNPHWSLLQVGALCHYSAAAAEVRTVGREGSFGKLNPREKAEKEPRPNRHGRFSGANSEIYQ